MYYLPDPDPSTLCSRCRAPHFHRIRNYLNICPGEFFWVVPKTRYSVEANVQGYFQLILIRNYLGINGDLWTALIKWETMFLKSMTLRFSEENFLRGENLNLATNQHGVIASKCFSIALPWNCKRLIALLWVRIRETDQSTGWTCIRHGAVGRPFLVPLLSPVSSNNTHAQFHNFSQINI